MPAKRSPKTQETPISVLSRLFVQPLGLKQQNNHFVIFAVFTIVIPEAGR
jgi:hypothetical protein